MKRTVFILTFFVSSSLFSQTNIQYGYDANGNRIQRQLVVSDPNTQRTSEAPKEEKAKETAKELGLSVFPNPAQDKVQVAINNLGEKQEARVLLIDAQGKNLLDKKTTAQHNEVDMTPFKPGVYFIKVVVGKETLFYKVLKL